MHRDLILEQGQPIYSKAIPLEGEFQPLPKAKSIPVVEPFYSSLERLIEKQRPLDKRNGTQWRKYLITQGMSQAEMKHTGVWNELEKSERKDIPKETLLATIDKNRAVVKSYDVQVDKTVDGSVVLRWYDPRDEEIGIPSHVYEQLEDSVARIIDNKAYYVQESENGNFSIIKANIAGDGTQYFVYLEGPELLSSEPHGTLSDARHAAQQLADGQTDVIDAGTDWRSITVEKNAMYAEEQPRNYREVLIQLPTFATDKLTLLENAVATKVKNTLNSHF